MTCIDFKLHCSYICNHFVMKVSMSIENISILMHTNDNVESAARHMFYDQYCSVRKHGLLLINLLMKSDD